MRAFSIYICIAVSFLNFTPANAETSPEVKKVHPLYEKAFEAILTLDDSKTRDGQLEELASEQLILYQNIGFAKNVLSKIENPIFKSEIFAKIAKEEAKQENCENADKNLENAYNSDLREDLSKRQRHYRSGIALRAIVEAYAYCNQVDKTVEIVQNHIENSLKEKQYLANAYSAIASIRYELGDNEAANRYFDLAYDIANPVQNETHRSAALSNIAYNQISAGLYDDAFDTAMNIKQTSKPAVGMAARFSSYRNSVLIKIACYYAAIDDWKKADRVIINQSVLDGRLYPGCLLDAYLEKIMELDREKALKNLRVRADSLKRHKEDRGLIKVALAYADLGDKEKAILILERLYQKYLLQYQEEIEDGRKPSPSIVWFIDDAMQAYVIASGDMKSVIDKITIKSFADFKAHNFKDTWGALIGRSTIEQNEAVLEKVKNILADDVKNSSVLFGTFLYFLEVDNFEKARETIERMKPLEKSGTYMMLARKISDREKGEYANKF